MRPNRGFSRAPLCAPPHRLPLTPMFVALAATVVVLGSLAVDKSAGTSAVVTAVTLDLVLVIPGLYYLFLIRGKVVPAITLLPVFRLSLLIADSVLPAGDRALYDLLAHLARPAEVGIVVYLVYRAHLGWRAFRSASTADVLDRYRSGVRAALPSTGSSVNRAADAIAFEGALMWFATRAWRSRPEFPATATAFTGHHYSAYGGVVAGLLMVIAVEVAAVHLLVSLWSPTAAWVLTGFSLYGAVWLVGDFQAIRLRPSWLDEDRLCMRVGVRWTLTVPLHQILRARKLAPSESVKNALRLSLPHARRVSIELHTPATATGVYGIQRTVRTIELGVDDPDEFLSRLDIRRGSSDPRQLRGDDRGGAHDGERTGQSNDVLELDSEHGLQW